MKELFELKNYIEKVEREAAKMMLQAHDVITENKTDARNIVTQYDGMVQELLIERLSEKLPDARFFCEENDRHDELTAEHLFIIDPIDGTMNFAKGLNHSCISVAYASKGEVLAAAVYNPYVDEMFSAVKGGGAFLNGRPMHVDDAGLDRSLVLVGTTPYEMDIQDESFAIIRKLFDASLDIRRQGSAALDMCSVAAGRAGLYFELRISLWDVAAGLLLMSEAGGVSMHRDGSLYELSPERCSIVACGKKTADDFLKMMNK